MRRPSLSHLRPPLRLVKAVLLTAKDTVRVLLLTTKRLSKTAATSVTVQAVLLLGNFWVAYSGWKAWQRARFAATLKMLTDLDEDGLRYLVQNLPAWVKFSDYERARFLNDAMTLLWPAFDTALAGIIKAHLEPVMREFAPSVIDGLAFERLSFGLVPVSILGVRSVPSWSSDNLAIELDLDVRWAGECDMKLNLSPSSKWLLNAVKIGKLKVLPSVNVTPLMAVQVRTVQVMTTLRICLAPVLDDVPFVGGISFSLMSEPSLDFDMRVLSGPDLLSIPALSSYLHSSVIELLTSALLWPKLQTVSFVPRVEEEEECVAPAGILTVRVLEARLPRRFSRLRKVEKRLDPYVCLSISPASSLALLGNQTALTSTQAASHCPKWHEERHLCLSGREHVLQVLVAHASASGERSADTPLGRVDLPLQQLVKEAAGVRLAPPAQAGSRIHRAAELARRSLARGEAPSPQQGPASATLPSFEGTDSGEGLPPGPSLSTPVPVPRSRPPVPHLELSPSAQERLRRTAEAAEAGVSLEGEDGSRPARLRNKRSLSDPNFLASAASLAGTSPSAAEGSRPESLAKRVAGLRPADIKQAPLKLVKAPLKALRRNSPSETSGSAPTTSREQPASWGFASAFLPSSKVAAEPVERQTESAPVSPSRTSVPSPFSGREQQASQGGRHRPGTIYEDKSGFGAAGVEDVLPAQTARLPGRATSHSLSLGRTETLVDQLTRTGTLEEQASLNNLPRALSASVPNKTAHELALAACGEAGAWLPLLPVNGILGGFDTRMDAFHPTLPQLSSLAEGVGDSFPALFGGSLDGTSTGAPEEGVPEGHKMTPRSLSASAAATKRRASSDGGEEPAGLASSEGGSSSSEASEGEEGSEKAGWGRMKDSFSNWGTANSAWASTAEGSSASEKPSSYNFFSRFSAPAASVEPGLKPPRTLRSKSTSERLPAAQRPSFLRGTSKHGKVVVAGAVRLLLVYHPLSATPQPYRRPVDPSASAQPQIGALSVLVLSSTLLDAKLLEPLLTISFGDTTQGLEQQGARCDWHYRCSFAISLPCATQTVEVILSDANSKSYFPALAARLWESWTSPNHLGAASTALNDTAHTAVPFASTQVLLADVLESGRLQGSWKLTKPSRTGELQRCGQISMRFAWLPSA